MALPLPAITPLAMLLAFTLLLGACVSAPPRAAPRAAVPTVPWAQRLVFLRGVRHFTLSGRLAATHDSAGFTAGLRWQQRDHDASLELSGPLGFGAVHVELTAETLSVTSGNGVKRDGTAAQDELAATLGFTPPLHSLRYWVLGASDPALGAEQSLDAQQRLAHLQQGGWRIDYDEYVPVQQQWLPRRLTVTRDNLRLKLVIDSWQL